MTRFIARSRAPLRLGLAGGGTDVPPYSDQFGGLAVGLAALHELSFVVRGSGVVTGGARPPTGLR